MENPERDFSRRGEREALTTTPILRIALDTPLRRLFDYLPPPDGVIPLVGTRVRVPFGRQRLVGVVIKHGEKSDLPLEKLKAVLEDCCRVQLDRRGTIVAYDPRKPNSCGPYGSCD